MATILHNDVIAFPQGNWLGIYWLRIIASSSQTAVVLTEVPHNPGTSVVNDIESVAEHVARTFPDVSPDSIWITSYLKESASEDSHFAEVRFLDDAFGDIEWIPQLTRQEAEARIGTMLPSLPSTHEIVRRVLESGGEIEEEIRLEYTSFPVEELPPPHNPSQCHHSDRFEKMARMAKAKTHQDHLAVGREFIKSLTETDFAACEYHNANWVGIARESVALVEELGPSPDQESLRAAVENTQLSSKDKMGLFSLFLHPITISSEGDYINGQHRGCALRAAGAKFVAVQGR